MLVTIPNDQHDLKFGSIYLTSDCYTISTILDPRFGLDYYKRDMADNNDSHEDVFAIVNAVYLRSYCPDACMY
jgi:hypothetical protein